MKKLIISLCSLCVLCMSFSVSASGKSALQQVETQYDFANKTMYTMVYMWQIAGALEDNCSASSLQAGDDWLAYLE